jgi:gamma-glutamylcyclotransferase (GGCT)/AIG2-like uncharacterized protein YtfP
MISEATTQLLPIFVYGTLMPGQPNDYLWQGCSQSVEGAYISGCYLYDFGYYPVMIKGGGGRVVGQLIHLKKECYSQTIQVLDCLEGYDSQHPTDSNFQRVRSEVSRPNGENLEAWAYFGVLKNINNSPLIENGDWAKHIAERENKLPDGGRK